MSAEDPEIQRMKDEFDALSRQITELQQRMTPQNDIEIMRQVKPLMKRHTALKDKILAAQRSPAAAGQGATTLTRSATEDPTTPGGKRRKTRKGKKRITRKKRTRRNVA